MNNKVKGWVQLIIVVLVIIASFAISNLLGAKRPPVARSSGADRALVVETQKVTPGPYRIAFETTGTVEARAEIGIVPQVSGRIVAVNDQFFEGGTFEADAVLFRIDPRDFELEVERLEAEVARAETGLDLENAEAEAALSEWRQINGSKTPPSLVARKPQMAEARANLKAAKAQLENARLDLERTRFSLPFSGRVLSSELAQGQYVTAGQSYGTVFDMETLEVRASLEDRQLEWLLSAESPDIIITATYLGRTREYRTFLKRGASSLDSQTRFATVSFGFEGTVRDVLPGVFVSIHIQGSHLSDVSLLPADALQKEGVVWIVKADNTLSALKPDIAYANDEYIAARGIHQTVNVVTSRLSGATEGIRVLKPGMKAEPHNLEKQIGAGKTAKEAIHES